MTNQQLPYWYPLKVIEGVPLPQENAINLVNELLDRYLNKRFISLFQEYGEPHNIYKNRVIKELQAKTFLRIASSLDPRLQNWLIENEGDEFSFRFKLAPFQEQVQVIQELYGEENVLSVSQFELRYKTSLNETLIKVYSPVDLANYGTRKRSRQRNMTRKTLAIRFQFVPELVKERKVLLMKGYAIAPITLFYGTIKKKFEQELRVLLQKQKERAEARKHFYEFITHVRDHVLSRLGESIHHGGPFEMSVPGAFNEYPLFPPCAFDLYNMVKETGYLPHALRVQLGLFLKGAGMDVETQLRFWYENAVDNKGFTFEQFLQKAGYQIRHLYGLVGSGIDYTPQKCETIVDQGHCPFRHRDPESLKELLLDQIRGIRGEKPFSEFELKQLENILSLAMKDQARKACSQFLSLITEHREGKPMVHPLVFLRKSLEHAGKGEKLMGKSRNGENKENEKTKKPITGGKTRND